ncbi:MAG: HXXEE domain-containing protein [Gammaproteobacteria bacterium]|nr:HXXEE domain-containing protein [Gammaproteobacteria bacterium]MBT8110224.1 HXXEE domain-containing protein [Gammaproteobacteria bacterium]NND48574.1 HXXEE domain-containing protein [Woeseiaceae bacterium]NNL44927.1 HXXEE domain-containing protein [Woeseiaceae bacterium]
MLLSLLPTLFVLGLAALAAIGLAQTRRSPPENAAQRFAAARILTLALVVQGIHFAEEALTGFPERLGALLGLPAMPMSFFLTFNVTWLAIWVVSVPALRAARRAAFFAAWFLAIAGMFNAVAHPLLAIAARGYFPGLASSPFIGAAAAWLWLNLREATTPRANLAC